MRRKFNKNYTKAEAIALHAEADKSDPFAARRMAMVLSKGHDNAKEVGEDAQRTINMRKADTRKSGNAFAALAPLRDRLRLKQMKQVTATEVRQRQKHAAKHFARADRAAKRAA